jgi:hypothetical protein
MKEEEKDKTPVNFQQTIEEFGELKEKKEKGEGEK